MNKVIIDTNIWISFLIGHQAGLVRKMLTSQTSGNTTKQESLHLPTSR